jgi:glutamate-1-semialdehyde aminotransferase
MVPKREEAKTHTHTHTHTEYSHVIKRFCPTTNSSDLKQYNSKRTHAFIEFLKHLLLFSIKMEDFHFKNIFCDTMLLAFNGNDYYLE